jgi:glycosyltransferase involved in cell wall biosynthesis
MVKIWTVIATKDRAEWMRKQLAALLPQCTPDEKVIVICDGDQETGTALRTEFTGEERLSIVATVDSGGPDFARRIGNAMVPPEAVILEVDDHDIVAPCCLEEIRRAFDETDALAVYSDCWHADKARTVVKEKKKPDGRTMADFGHLGWGLRAYYAWAYALAGGYPTAYFPVNDYALMAKIEQVVGADAIHHIARPLVTVTEDVRGISTTHKDEFEDQMERVANLALSKDLPVPFASIDIDGVDIAVRQDLRPVELYPMRVGQLAMVTPTRNRLDHLRESIPAALANDPWLLIVVDYGSTDGTAHWLKSLKDDRLVLVECPGASEVEWSYVKAQNTGIRVALSLGANLVGFFDCDVVLDSGWVERAGLTAMHTGVAAVRVEEEYRRQKGRGLGGTMVMRADVLARLNGYDEQMRHRNFEDTDLANRAAMVGTVAFYEQRMARHIQHGGERSAPNDTHAQNRAIMVGRSEPEVNAGFRLKDLGWQDTRIWSSALERPPDDIETAPEQLFGLFYTATGRFVEQARHSIMSARLHAPGLSVTTIGFEADMCITLDEEKVGPGGWNTRGWKLRAPELSPYKQTLYLDADTVALGDLRELRGVLDHYDLALCLDPITDFDGCRHLSPADISETRKVAGHVWPQYNGGAIGFRRGEGATAFYGAWHEEWVKRGRKDQGALTRAIQRARPRLFVLGRAWNGPRDGAILWHKICEGLPDITGKRGVVRDEIDLAHRNTLKQYLRRRSG